MSETLKTIVVATTNENKIREIRQELGDIPGYNFVSLADMTLQYGIGFVEPEETGETFQDNALLKAQGYLEQLKQFQTLQNLDLQIAGVFAEDSGFVATALTDQAEAEGLPEPMGPHTKRFLGEAKGADRTRKVLDALQEAHDQGFASTEGLFTCAMILLLTEGDEVELHEAIGELLVNIADQPVWNPEDPKVTFFLDPITVPQDQAGEKPVALSQFRQMSVEERAATGIITHRAAAVAKVREILLGEITD